MARQDQNTYTAIMTPLEIDNFSTSPIIDKESSTLPNFREEHSTYKTDQVNTAGPESYVVEGTVTVTTDPSTSSFSEYYNASSYDKSTFAISSSSKPFLQGSFEIENETKTKYSTIDVIHPNKQMSSKDTDFSATSSQQYIYSEATTNQIDVKIDNEENMINYSSSAPSSYNTSYKDSTTELSMHTNNSVDDISTDMNDSTLSNDQWISNSSSTETSTVGATSDYKSRIGPMTTDTHITKWSPQRVEYNEDDRDDIYWRCPPTDNYVDGSQNIDFEWFKLRNGIKDVSGVRGTVDKITNTLEIKDPNTRDEGRYMCVSHNTSLFVSSTIFFYQFIILKSKWIDIGSRKNVSIHFNQKLIINCPHGDITRGDTSFMLQCPSRTTIIERYPKTSQTVYRCTNSPNETIKLSATESSSNCSVSLHGCPSQEGKSKIINFDRCIQQKNDSINPWGVKRCQGQTFIRFYYDIIKQQCLPFETDICGSDYYSFLAMDECERNCILIKSDIQRCFYPQNLDKDQVCGDSSNGEYMVTYNIVSNACEWFFQRTGCPSSKNVFSSIKQCRQTCIQNVRFVKLEMRKACTYKMASTEMSLYNVKRWVYFPGINDCREKNVSLTGNPFVLSFTLRRGCHICRAVTTTDLCQTRPENGLCLRQEITWHFNYIGRKCIRILDGGCGDSLNRFSSKMECQRVCAKHIISATTTVATTTIGSTTADADASSFNTTMYNAAFTKTRTIINHDLKQSYEPLVPTTTERNRVTITPKAFDVSKRLLDYDPCFGRTLMGTCSYGANKQNYSLIRYTFVPTLSQCHRVLYSGCNGDENLFDDSNDCKSACQSRLYSLKSKKCHHPLVYNCIDQSNLQDSSRLIRYHYSSNEKQCVPFTSVSSTTCLQQFFLSIDKCQRLCHLKPPSEIILQNKCFGKLVLDDSSCSANEKTQLWFYMSNIKQCLQYSTCPVLIAGNVFSTKSECEDSCIATDIFTMCSLPPDSGMGNVTKIKYFFDGQRRKCRIFIYKGSLGNSNRFRSVEECHQVCVKNMLDMDTGAQASSSIEHTQSTVFDYQGTTTNITSLKIYIDREYCYDVPKYGVCNLLHPQVYITKYFYNSYRRQCEPYLFSGCGSTSRNSFDSIAICEGMCTTRIQRSMSSMCTRQTYRCSNSSWIYWRYNSDRGDCELFPSCIKQSADDTMFRDLDQCSRSCIPPLPMRKDLFDICHLPPTPVSHKDCHSSSKRWFYDYVTGTCTSSLSCRSYGNNFPSYLSCLQSCEPNEPWDVCKLPMDSGPCTSNITVFYYFNWASQSCESLTYGGCLGNRNRFASHKDCMAVCSIRNRCNIPIKKTACRKVTEVKPPIYVYNSTKNMCEQINYTVCGNYLEFYSYLGQCETDCVILDEVRTISFNIPKKVSLTGNRRCLENLKFNNYPICLKSQDWLPRYYYDDDRHECLFFYYNGCNGLEDQGNRFHSKNICQETCLSNQSTTTSISTTSFKYSTKNSTVENVAIKRGMCPRSHLRCSPLVSDFQVCKTDTDCGHYLKCCACETSGALVHHCMEAVGCMLTSYGCCSDSEIVAPDILHNGCSKTTAKIVEMSEKRVLNKLNGQFQLECLVTGDPRPEIIWLHLDGKKNTTIAPKWDLTRPMWSGELELDTTDDSLVGMWLCSCINEAGQDDLEVIVTSTLGRITPRLMLYDPSHINSTFKYVALGGRVNLHCPIYGVPRPMITWFYNNSIITKTMELVTVQNRFIYLHNVPYEYGGWWICIAEQMNQSLSFMMELRVIEPLRILPSPHGNMIKATIGQKVILYCNVIGKPRPNIIWSWRKEGATKVFVALEKTDPRILEIRSFIYENRGEYICRTWNNVSEDSTVFSVGPVNDNDIVVEPAGFHFIGDQIALHCPAKPKEKIYHVIWKKDNVYMETKGLILNFILHSKLDSGFYTCHHGGRTYQTHVYVHSRPAD